MGILDSLKAIELGVKLEEKAASWPIAGSLVRKFRTPRKVTNVLVIGAGGSV